MLIEKQVVRSKPELLKELQGLPVTKAVIYRNVDRKAWEQIAKDNQEALTEVIWNHEYSDWPSYLSIDFTVKRDALHQIISNSRYLR